MDVINAGKGLQTLGLLGAYIIYAELDLYRAIPAETRDFGLHVLIRGTAPFSRLLQKARGILSTHSNPNHASV